MKFKTLRRANCDRDNEMMANTPASEESWTPREMALKLVEEVGEIARLLVPNRHHPEDKEWHQALHEEIADVVIVADLLAMYVGAPSLSDIVREKFNKTSQKRGLSTLL